MFEQRETACVSFVKYSVFKRMLHVLDWMNHHWDLQNLN